MKEIMTIYTRVPPFHSQSKEMHEHFFVRNRKTLQMKD